jgi:RNA polymerase sigma-70 factor (ECF subfamily)
VTDWDRIVREHGPRVFGTAWRILGHAADTEDVVQDVFLEAFRLRTTQPVRNWAALLHRMATCRALDRLRQRRSVVSLDSMALADSTPDPEAAAIGQELAERLRQAVAELPEREAAVFCLRYFEEESNQRIAEVLNITPGAVGVALHKARTRLEELLVFGERGASTQ